MLFLKLMSHHLGCVRRGEGVGSCPATGEQLGSWRSFQETRLWVLRSHVPRGFRAATHLVRVLGPAPILRDGGTI